MTTFKTLIFYGSNLFEKRRAFFSALSSTLLITLSLLIPSIVLADWVQVTGRAPYLAANYSQSRAQAQDDALQQAALEFGGNVQTTQEIHNGVLKKDVVNYTNEARVKRSVIRNEYVWKGMLHLVMDVELEEMPTCPRSKAADYKKTVAVLGFSIQTPAHTRMGGLQNADRGLASVLSQNLHEQGGLLVFQQSLDTLYTDVVNAPSHMNGQRALTHATDFAKDVGAQFVISGVIRDMGVVNEDAFKPSIWQSFKNFGKAHNKDRNFTVDVFVHDGFNGSIIWQRQFSVVAPWDSEANLKVGFGSAEFWQNSYGQAVSGLVRDMAMMIDEQLTCQPFMTRISRVEGKTLHFASGASTGVRPGDTFSIYRTRSFFDADQQKGVELKNVRTALTVSQVHPSFASGTIPVESGRLNIQEDDLLVVW